MAGWPSPASRELRRRCGWGLDVIRGENLRMDAEDGAVRLLAALHRLAPPEGARLSRRWYVPVAVARMNRALLAQEARLTPKGLRGAIGRLEALGLLVRSPGDAHRRGRYGATLHLVRTDAERRWWATEGAARLEAHPEARRCPRAWQEHFGGWREDAREAFARGREEEMTGASIVAPNRRLLPGPRVSSTAEAPPAAPAAREAAVAAMEQAAADGDRAALQKALRGAGVRFRGGWRFRFWQRLESCRRAVALLCERVRAVGWPRSVAAWLVWAWKAGSGRASEALHRLVKASSVKRAKPCRPHTPAHLEPSGLEFLGDLGSILKSAAIPDADADLERLRVGLERW